MTVPKVTQVGMQKFPSPCGKANLHVDNDMALGALHDFLMAIKGDIVNRMILNQKQEEEIAAAQRAAQAEAEKPSEEVPQEPIQIETQAG